MDQVTPASAGTVDRHDTTVESTDPATGAVDGGVIAPTVLVDVPETLSAVREETFGPTLTIR